MRRKQATTYTIWHELGASPTQPMPEEKRTHHLTMMWQGLASMEKDESPKPDDWRKVADAVNIMETMVTAMKIAQDESGLLQDASKAMAEAALRHVKTGAPIRLDGPGIQAVRAVLEDYASLLEQLPERVVVRAHRLTEIRIIEAQTGKRRPGDVVIKL